MARRRHVSEVHCTRMRCSTPVVVARACRTHVICVGRGNRLFLASVPCVSVHGCHAVAAYVAVSFTGFVRCRMYVHCPCRPRQCFAGNGSARARRASAGRTERTARVLRVLSRRVDPRRTTLSVALSASERLGPIWTNTSHLYLIHKILSLIPRLREKKQGKSKCNGGRKAY